MRAAGSSRIRSSGPLELHPIRWLASSTCPSIHWATSFATGICVFKDLKMFGQSAIAPSIWGLMANLIRQWHNMLCERARLSQGILQTCWRDEHPSRATLELEER